MNVSTKLVIALLFGVFAWQIAIRLNKVDGEKALAAAMNNHKNIVLIYGGDW